ncbi:hypothetical protein [Streptomyces purpurascens]
MLDELVRRVTGRGAGEWLAARRSAARWAWTCGSSLPEAEAHRVGTRGPRSRDPPEPGALARPPEALGQRGLRGPGLADPAGPSPAMSRPFPDQNDPRLPPRRPCPPTNGVATADGVARLLRVADRRHGRRRHASSTPAGGRTAPGPRSRRAPTASWWSAPASAWATCCTAAPRPS